MKTALFIPCVLAAVIALTPTVAHEAFAEYIWHRVQLSVNARHLDVSVELTFFETWSSRERRRMDTNHDRRIQRREADDYARQLEAAANERVALFLGGQRVTLIPLFSPEVDLAGHDTATGGHHRMTLRYFAPLPAGLPHGTAIRVEERLWPEARTLAELAATPESAAQLELEQVADRAVPVAGAAPLKFNARYVKPDAAPRSADQRREHSD